MKLTTEMIERILNEAPEGATHFSEHLNEEGVQYYLKYENDSPIHECWYGWCAVGEAYEGWWLFDDEIVEEFNPIHAIDDLREILELRKEVERLRGKLSEVSKVLGGTHSAAEWPTSYCISEIEDSLNIDGFLKGEVK